jgi:hypothetical protein
MRRGRIRAVERLGAFATQGRRQGLSTDDLLFGEVFGTVASCTI